MAPSLPSSPIPSSSSTLGSFGDSGRSGHVWLLPVKSPQVSSLGYGSGRGQPPTDAAMHIQAWQLMRQLMRLVGAGQDWLWGFPSPWIIKGYWQWWVYLCFFTHSLLCPLVSSTSLGL